jgi:hypothetical protein
MLKTTARQKNIDSRQLGRQLKPIIEKGEVAAENLEVLIKGQNKQNDHSGTCQEEQDQQWHTKIEKTSPVMCESQNKVNEADMSPSSMTKSQLYIQQISLARRTNVSGSGSHSSLP